MIGVGVSGWVYLASRAKPVTSHNVVDAPVEPGVSPLDPPVVPAPVAA